MANKTIKGGIESYIMDDSKTTFVLAKNAFLHYSDFGYGIYEDIASEPDIHGNTYKIDGKLTGFSGGIATYGDDTKIILGKTADVNAQLGIGIGSIIGDPEDPIDPSSLSFGTIFAGGDNSKITIAKGAEIGGLIGVTVTGKGSSVTNSGEMDNALVGIMAGSFNLTSPEPEFAEAALTTTKLTNNGSIEAGVGIVGLGADNQIITNGKKGEIEGLVGMVGGLIPTSETPEEFGKLKMQNSGDIIATVGMLGIFSPNMTLTNAKGAEIIAGAIGIGALTMSSEGAPPEMDFSIKITNAGTISVASNFNLDDLPDELGGALDAFLMPAAILGGAGNEVVVNTGKIVGHVVLGEGDDTFTMEAGSLKGDVVLGNGNDTLDFAGGKIKGEIHGGDGNDTYIITKAIPTIVELVEEGVDTVKSAVSYTLAEYVDNLELTGKKNIDGTGNDGANVLIGNKGKNILDGGLDADALTGGAGADTFVFATGHGNDTITDFTAAQHDRIDVSGWTGIVDFASIQDHATQDGGDVVIAVGGDSLVIANHLIADLSAADFNFA